jgi:hypothetical protein
MQVDRRRLKANCWSSTTVFLAESEGPTMRGTLPPKKSPQEMDRYDVLLAAGPDHCSGRSDVREPFFQAPSAPPVPSARRRARQAYGNRHHPPPGPAKRPRRRPGIRFRRLPNFRIRPGPGAGPGTRPGCIPAPAAIPGPWQPRRMDTPLSSRSQDYT